MSVLPLAKTGTIVSSPCKRSATKTCASIRFSNDASTAQQAPTWSAKVDRRDALPGVAFAERALAQRPDLKVLYMFGYTDGAIERRGGLNPGVNLLQKPFRRRDPGLKLREALDHVPGRR